MARILLLSFGSYGDIAPFLSLSLALKRRGHITAILTHEHFKETVLEHADAFYPLGLSPLVFMNELTSKTSLFSLIFVNRFIQRWLSHFHHMADAAHRSICHFRPQLAVTSPVLFTCDHVLTSRHVPFIHLFTMPWEETTQHTHPLLGGRAFCPIRFRYATLNRLSNKVISKSIPIALSQAVAAYTKDHPQDAGDWQLPAVTAAAYAIAPPRPRRKVFAYPRPLLHPRLSDAPSSSVGAIWPPGQDRLHHPVPTDPKILNFLEHCTVHHSPPVYLGLGSVPDRTPAFFEAVRYAVRMLPHTRWVVAAGWTGIDSWSKMVSDLPSDRFLVIKSVPHSWLLPRCSLVICHGGAGTVAAALRSGRPMVISPHFADQFFWGSVVEKRGVGVRLRRMDGYSLVRAVLRCVGDRQMHACAQRVGDKIRGEQGLSEAVEAVEAELDASGANE